MVGWRGEYLVERFSRLSDYENYDQCKQHSVICCICSQNCWPLLVAVQKRLRLRGPRLLHTIKKVPAAVSCHRETIKLVLRCRAHSNRPIRRDCWGFRRPDLCDLRSMSAQTFMALGKQVDPASTVVLAIVPSEEEVRLVFNRGSMYAFVHSNIDKQMRCLTRSGYNCAREQRSKLPSWLGLVAGALKPNPTVAPSHAQCSSVCSHALAM